MRGENFSKVFRNQTSEYDLNKRESISPRELVACRISIDLQFESIEFKERNFESAVKADHE